MADYDLVVIGGGPWGYVAALRGAQLGARVALVEEKRVGGVCLNEGCIPTKALARSVELLLDIERAQEFGILVSEPALDFAKMMARKEMVVERLVSGVEALLQARKVELFKGKGRLLAPNKVAVDGRELSTRGIIIATGAEPGKPPVAGLDLEGVLTSSEILELEEAPSRLVIVGGGVIGMEFVTLFNALGTKVTVIEMLPSLLPPVDEELSRRYLTLVRREGVEVHLNSPLRGVQKKGPSLVVEYGGDDRVESVEAEYVLIATGRLPYTEGLGLSELGVKTQGRAIVVDDYLQTSVPGVYAVGDVTGGWMLAHVAFRQGEIAAENALGNKKGLDYRAVPYCVFTLPEIAGVGLTEQEAKGKGIPYKKSIFRFTASGRALTMGETTGLVKMLCHEEGEVLGLHIMGPRATDLIAEVALAIQMGAKASDIVATIHAHPTLPEAVREAALGQFEGPIHALS
ncbi:MAG: dihydrolipoyl dehydrogenase [Anaerolineae bacterium]|nr:dihydrolipoyl dehydrogenase [Anaerolineae bacterium]